MLTNILTISISTYTGMTDSMEHAFCKEKHEKKRHCDLTSVADHKKYLGTILGLNELIYYINNSAKKYPMHASVIFVGDSSDSISKLVNRSKHSPNLEKKPALVAIQKMFINAANRSPIRNSWEGKLFLEFSNSDFMGAPPKADLEPKRDSGYSAYYSTSTTSGSNPVENPDTIRLWKKWPNK